MNHSKLKSQLLMLMALLITLPCYAVSIGDVARNITAPLSNLSHFVRIVCLLTGIALLFGAFIKYRIHRQNPVEVPIGTPIMMVVVAIGLIAIYFTQMVQV